MVTTYRCQKVSAVRTHGQGMTPPSEAVGVIVQRIAIDRAGEITSSIGATLQNFWSAAASGRDTPDKTLCHTLSPPPHAPQPAQQRGARCVLPARPPARAPARPPALQPASPAAHGTLARMGHAMAPYGSYSIPASLPCSKEREHTLKGGGGRETAQLRRQLPEAMRQYPV